MAFAYHCILFLFRFYTAFLKGAEDADIYSALPFCLCVFVGMNTRNGTDVDAASVMQTFSKLGYKTEVVNDQTVAQMKKVLLSGKKSIVFVVFS